MRTRLIPTKFVEKHVTHRRQQRDAWFLPKQKHSDDRSKEIICIHPEARSSTDTDLMQIDGPSTAEETHSDKAQMHTVDTHTMPEDDDNPHTAQMQTDEQGDLKWDCLFSKKTAQ